MGMRALLIGAEDSFAKRDCYNVVMEAVLPNIGTLLFVISLWTICGIGPVLWLAPKTRFLTWLLLSPFFGYMLIAALGVARLEFFLAPAAPLIDCSILASIGLAAVYIRRKNIRRRWRRTSRSLLRLSGPYFAYLFLYAFIFGATGFETLSTGSDEVIHGLMETQIIQNAHRGTPNDNPIMREDHYVQDYPAKDLTYEKKSRKGSDMLTIATSVLLHIAPERVYPVTFGCLALVLAAAVLHLCRNAYGMNLRLCWPIPLFFLASGGVWRLNVEGNFSNFSSWAMFLLAPWFLIQALTETRLRWLFPLALIGSSVYSFYYEPALVALLLPAGLGVLYCIVRRKTSPRKLLAAAAFVPAVAIFLNPTLPFKFLYSTDSVKAQTLAGSMGGPFSSIAAYHVSSWPGVLLAAWRKLYVSDWWPHVVNVLLGVGSAVNASELNQTMRNFLGTFPILTLLGIYLMVAIACYGLVRGFRPVGVLGAIVLLAWVGVAHTAVLVVTSASFFTFYRAMMYSLPWTLLGLGLAFCHGRAALTASSKISRYWALAPVFGSAGFLFMNAFSSAATATYVRAHSICDDPWIRRLNPDAGIWQDLRATLSEFSSPTLISGFSEPPRILWLGSSIRPTRHFMGKSTSDKWPFGAHAVPDKPYYWTRLVKTNPWTSGWYTKLSEPQLSAIAAQEETPWNEVYPKFLAESEISLVPVRRGWPVEWDARSDIFGPLTIEYPNIADTIYRRRLSVTPPSAGLGPLAEDETGPYREFLSDAAITAHTRVGWVEISIAYSGKPGDLKVSDQWLSQFGPEIVEDGTTTAEFRYLRQGKDVNLTLTGKPGVRVRDISLRVLPASLGCSADKVE